MRSPLGTQPCCHWPQPEEPSLEQILFWRCLSSRRLLFWILFHPFGLMLLFVCLHCQGEHEVRFYVRVLPGRRPEVYQHLWPLPHTLGKLLWLILQHGCSGIPSEMRKGDLTNRPPPQAAGSTQYGA